MAEDRKLRGYFEYMFENMDYCVARMVAYFMSERELKSVMRTNVSKMYFSRQAYGDGLKSLKYIRPYFYTGKSELCVPAMLCQYYIKNVDTKGVEVDQAIIRKYFVSCVDSANHGKKHVNGIINFKRWSNDTGVAPDKLGAAYVAYLYNTVPRLKELAAEAMMDIPQLTIKSENVVNNWVLFNKAYNCFCFATGQFTLNGASPEFVPYATVANSYLGLLEDLVGYHSMNKPCMHITSPYIDNALDGLGDVLTLVSLNSVDGSLTELNSSINTFSKIENLEHILQQGIITMYMLYRVWRLAYRMTDAYSDVRVFWNLYGGDSFFNAVGYKIKEFAPVVYETINDFFTSTGEAGESTKVRASFAYVKNVAEIVGRCNKAIEECGFNPFFDISEFDRLIKVSDDEKEFDVEYTAFVERIRSHLMVKGVDGKAELVYGLGSEARKMRSKMRACAPEILTLTKANAFLSSSHVESTAVGFWGDGASEAAATLTRLKAGVAVSYADLKSGDDLLMESANLNIRENAPIAVSVSGRDFIIQSREAQQKRFVNVHKGIEAARGNPLNKSVDQLYEEAVKYAEDLNNDMSNVEEIPKEQAEGAGSKGDTETAATAVAVEPVITKEEEAVKSKINKGSTKGQGDSNKETVNETAATSNSAVVDTAKADEAATIRVITETIPKVQTGLDLFSETAQPWSVYELGWLLGFDFENDDIRDILTELPNHSYNSCLQKAEMLHSLYINTQADLRRYLKANGQN